MDLAQMAKLTALIREHSISGFISVWQPLLEYLPMVEKNDVLILGFNDSWVYFNRNNATIV